MVTTLIAGSCAPCSWRSTSACPSVLRIALGTYLGFLNTVSINFASRGKVGGYCGGSDEYVTFTDNGATSGSVTVDVDIWRAYQDGIWSSSSTISIYMVSGFAGGISALVYPLSDPGGSISFPVTYYLDGGVCPFVVPNTLNIYDDGTFS